MVSYLRGSGVAFVEPVWVTVWWLLCGCMLENSCRIAPGKLSLWPI